MDLLLYLVYITVPGTAAPAMTGDEMQRLAYTLAGVMKNPRRDNVDSATTVVNNKERLWPIGATFNLSRGWRHT